MRIVFYNPQINLHYGRTLYYFLIRAKSYHKYTYLLNYAYSKQGKVYVYIHKDFRTFSFLPLRIEIYLWSMLNKINPFNLKVLNPEHLKDDDVLLCISYGNSINESLDTIKNKNLVKLMHATHYAIETSQAAQNFKRYNFKYIMAENDLFKNSSYFRTFYPFYKKDVYVLPFVPQERFKKYISFKKRVNKCLATGTYENLLKSHAKGMYKDLFRFYKVRTLHPLREGIYLNKNKLSELIDSYIGVAYDRPPKTGSKNLLGKIFKVIYNVIFASRRKYFAFDIVRKYNEYKMFVVPEEISGLPGIGFVEGMACGAAYIGKKDPMYEDLGLRAGKHYIGYDGTLPDLKKKIIYYQKHQKELEKIAESGYKFVMKNFNGERVAKLFWEDLEKFVKGKTKKLESSFIQ